MTKGNNVMTFSIAETTKGKTKITLVMTKGNYTTVQPDKRQF